MGTKTKSKEKVSVKEILSQPYVLILHNDDYNSFDHVIECLIKFCGHDQSQAAQAAHLVHFVGKCDVKRGDHETITKIFNKLKASSLTVTIESN